ncbi:kinase phosphorylation protein-domain-containing protein [Xylariaceae sp. FL1019]|nr:kinase phosphorylation protein-domain-containing protein [Xylariaceae sp. FL1019]
MDLVSSIRKTGSRGGVNFNWEDVTTSAHRENYLGHSLKAPVGRWQQGRDLNWYAKGDADEQSANETAEETAARKRKEELQKIKEAEEDAIARALGLPVPVRNVSGANAVEVGMSRVGTQEGSDFAEVVAASSEARPTRPQRHEDSDRRHRKRHRSRSRNRDRSRDRGRDRGRDHGRARRRDRSARPRDERHPDRHRRARDDEDDRHDRLSRHRRMSRSAEKSDRRQGYIDGHRSRSRDRRRSRSPDRRRRRSPGRN